MKTTIIEETNDYNAVPTCKIQVINDDTMKWETLTTVPDTPKHVKEAVKHLENKGHTGLWKKDCVGNRTYIG